jgi:hypothetical protein
LRYRRRPGCEEAPLCCFNVVAHDNAEVFPSAPGQSPAAQRSGLETDQQRDQKPNDKLHGFGSTQQP